MAQVVWREKAARLLAAHLDYAFAEFGRKALSNWYKEIKQIESRMSIHPESYTIEPLIADKSKKYRGAIIMKKFKLIHFYDIKTDTVYIDYIWDMRMNPEMLKELSN